MLRIDEPGTSFPETLSTELLNEFQVFSVEIDAYPEIEYSQDATRMEPVYENEKWVQHWSITDVDAETLQERRDQQAGIIRDKRNKLLQECDWSQGRDISDQIALLWQSYRQQLRDITNQSGFPFNIEWPTKPA
jgi:hypothetical protein